MLFAAADYRVQLYDIEPRQLTGAFKEIEAQLDNLSKIGLLRGHLTVKQQLGNITVTTDIRECVKGAIYVQVITKRMNQYMTKPKESIVRTATEPPPSLIRFLVIRIKNSRVFSYPFSLGSSPSDQFSLFA